jgi:NAD(P)-dependent dehydrogenase (short-subunit alcohol dehydrogenase family)
VDHTALVTGADRGLGLALSKGLLERGWHVFAGQYMPDWPELGALASHYAGLLHIVPLDVSSTESAHAAAQAVSQQADHLDLLISNAGIGGGRRELREGLDSGAIHRVYDVNALGAIRVVEAFLPLMDRGMRRLGFVSSEAGSIAMAHRQSGFAYGMSKAALNMAVRLMFNHLRPEGYTFRLYYPGWIRSYMSGTKSTAGDMEPEEAAALAIPFFLEPRDDEDRLALIGYQGEEWPF